MRLVIGTTLFLAATASGFAADLAPQPMEPVAAYAPYSWTGFYLGVHAGGVFGNSKVLLAPAAANRFSLNNAGFIGGAHAGYNYQFDNNIVVGLETDFDYSSLSKTTQVSPITTKFRNEWQGSTRARIGYAFDRFLPYLTAGVAYGNEKVTSRATNGDRLSYGDTRVGWTVGGGLEYAIDQNWLVRGEVRYTDFGNKRSNAVSAHGIRVRTKTRFDDVTATLGVSYKF